MIETVRATINEPELVEWIVAWLPSREDLVALLGDDPGAAAVLGVVRTLRTLVRPEIGDLVRGDVDLHYDHNGFRSLLPRNRDRLLYVLDDQGAGLLVANDGRYRVEGADVPRLLMVQPCRHPVG